MSNYFSFFDLLGLISFIPFLIPDKYMNYQIRIYLFILGLFIYLIMKIFYLINELNKKQKKIDTITNELNDIKNKHKELSSLYDDRINKIEILNNRIYKYSELLTILHTFLITTLSVQEDNKQLISQLIELLLQHRKFIQEDDNNEYY